MACWLVTIQLANALMTFSSVVIIASENTCSNVIVLNFIMKLIKLVKKMYVLDQIV